MVVTVLIDQISQEAQIEDLQIPDVEVMARIEQKAEEWDRGEE